MIVSGQADMASNLIVGTKATFNKMPKEKSFLLTNGMLNSQVTTVPGMGSELYIVNNKSSLPASAVSNATKQDLKSGQKVVEQYKFTPKEGSTFTIKKII